MTLVLRVVLRQHTVADEQPGQTVNIGARREVVVIAEFFERQREAPDEELGGS